ncbi:hypothetical protein [Streptomyces sp. NPDC020681]|uniref:hypothetical protein n=1 Tax=Streptomyces sp. NPDC020681 TaxID=3365083 RepID=UPI00378BB06D
MKAGRAMAVAAVTAATLLAAAPPGNADTKSVDPLHWCNWTHHPDLPVVPPFEFAFEGAPRNIVDGSGWHTFSVHITGKHKTPGRNDFRWHAAVYNRKLGRTEEPRRSMPGARIEYRDSQGHWRPVHWDRLRDAPLTTGGLDDSQKLRLRVKADSGPSDGLAYLHVSAGDQIPPPPHPPEEPWFEEGPCLDGSLDTQAIRFVPGVLGIPVVLGIAAGAGAGMVAVGVIVVRRRRRRGLKTSEA